MKHSKIIALACAVAVTSTVFTGCFGKEKDTAVPSSTQSRTTVQAQAGTGQDAKVSAEKITVSAFASPFPEAKLFDFDYDKNHFTKWLEDTTNVHIEWILAPSAGEVSQKLSTLISSNEIPDIMFQNGFTPSVQELYGKQGLILELNDYIEKYGTNIKKMFSEVPTARAAVELNEGKIYCMPSYVEDVHMRSFYKMWIYKPWLDKLNLPMPKTTDEFYTTLKAFKEKDPNGNGKADEIPMLGCTAWLSWSPLTYIMNAFVYYDPNRKMLLNNGKVEPVYTSPEFAEGIKYMAKLTNEKLLSSETFTMDLNNFKQTVENPDVPLVGAIPSHAPFVVATTRYKDYVPMEPLVGPKGVQNAYYNYITSNMGVVVSAQAKHPVEIFKMLDFLYSTEAGIRSKEGRPGIEWDYCKEGEGAGRDGRPAKYKRLVKSTGYNENEGEKNVSWYMIANVYKPQEYVNSWMEGADAKNNPEKVLEESTVKLYMPHQPDVSKILPQTIVFTEQESEEITDIDITVSDYVTESMTRFILKMGSVDGEWNTYLKELKGMGMDRLIEVYQAAVSRRK